MESNTRGKLRKCRICDRTFGRTEHLVRHERTHNNERPFECQMCKASFARADVLQNHLRRLHGHEYVDGKQVPKDVAYMGQRRRARKACQACRQRKLRCSGVAPCALCVGSHRPCVFVGELSTNFSVNDQIATSLGSGSGSGSVSGLGPGPGCGSVEIGDAAVSELERTPYADQDVNIVNPTDHGNMSSLQTKAFAAQEADAAPPIRLERDPNSLDMLIYEGRPSNSQTGDLLETHHHAVSTSVDPDEVLLFDGDPNMVDVGDIMDLWPMTHTDSDSYLWTDGLNLDLFPTSFRDDHALLTLGDLSAPHLEPQPGSSKTARDTLGVIRSYFEHNGGDVRPVGQLLSFSAPQAQVYDAELVDLLAALAKHHLIKVFPILSVQLGNRRMHTPSDLYHLAMAAVGGLYCDLPGRFCVVNAMYNDSRRILLERAQRTGFSSPRDKLGAIRTFILLEIYGLCSGDKRSFEFVEAFHARMLLLVKEFKRTTCERLIASPPALHQANRALDFSLHVLACYRVLLLQRPVDSLFKSSCQFDPHNAVAPLPEDAEERLLYDLFTPDRPPTTTDDNYESAMALFKITILASFRLTSSDTASIVRSLWNMECFDLALSRWNSVQSQESADWSLFVLYHLICIHLHTNIRLIHRLAYAVSGVRGDVHVSKMWSSLDPWRRSRHYPAARWHAQTMLSRVNDALASGVEMRHARGNDDLDGINDSGSKTWQQFVPPEAPHLPYAVYTATLVLWCGDHLSTDPAKAASTTNIDTSILLLAGMRVRIAALLQRMLRRLRPAVSTG